MSKLAIGMITVLILGVYAIAARFDEVKARSGGSEEIRLSCVRQPLATGVGRTPVVSASTLQRMKDEPGFTLVEIVSRDVLYCVASPDLS
jgi:hypothetical protein